MDFKLDFAVIGIQKSATTWLYKCLEEHPQINMRNNKLEFDYFGSEKYDKNGHDWYVSLFKKEAYKLKGCVSVEYIEDEKSPLFLFKNNPNLKIIISIRNPVNRLISAYEWGVRKSLLPNLSVEDGLKQVLKCRAGEINNEYTRFYLDLINRGLYLDRLEKYFDLFSKEQILIVYYDDIKENPKLVLQNIFQFLQIDEHFKPSKMNTKPKKNTGNFITNNIERLFSKNRVIRKLLDMSNQFLFSKNNYDAKKLASDKTIQQIEEIFKVENQKLERLLQREYPNKKKPSWL